MKVIKNEILVEVSEEELLAIVREKAGITGDKIVKIQRVKTATGDKPAKPVWGISIA